MSKRQANKAARRLQSNRDSLKDRLSVKDTSRSNSRSPVRKSAKHPSKDSLIFLVRILARQAARDLHEQTKEPG